jgi:hypothetical protein
MLVSEGMSRLPLEKKKNLKTSILFPYVSFAIIRNFNDEIYDETIYTKILC